MSLSRDLSQLKTQGPTPGLGRSQLAGYGAPLSIQLATLAPRVSPQGSSGATGEGDRQKLYQMAREVLQEPLAMQQLATIVYQQLQQDVAHQRLRNQGYGGQR